MASLAAAVGIAEVTRRDQRTGRDVVESVHAGHVVVLGPDGEVFAALGDPGVTVYVRSAAKPFQATACLELLAEQGVAPPSSAELAVSWASHRGDPDQLARVRDLLGRSGTPPERLTCPPGVPEADPGVAPTRLAFNCSGKHALFALAGMAVGAARERLLDPDGPVQTRVLALLHDTIGPVSAVGVDGCGAPAVVAGLDRLAAGFRDLAAGARWRAVRAAGFAHPALVGGEGRLDSALLAAGVVSKVGAEGVYGAGWERDDGPWGAAVKCVDGAQRGAAAALIAALEAVGAVPSGVWTPPPPTGGGRPAGEVRATPAVRSLDTGG